jgi:FkbM family methyltransferase
MSTSKEKGDLFINAGSEIEQELYKIFDKGAAISIADIGACDGLSSIIYAKMFPNAHIHAFEPLVENASEMCGNFQEYGIIERATIHLCALSNRAGIIKFYKSNGPQVDGWDIGNKSSSILRPKRHLNEHPWCKFTSIEANAHTLDQEHIKVDFAHIDVQGAELLVLKGGEKTFKTTKVIWIEVANIDLYVQQPLKSQVSHMLNHMGFIPVLDTCKNKKYGDMLWVKK